MWRLRVTAATLINVPWPRKLSVNRNQFHGDVVVSAAVRGGAMYYLLVVGLTIATLIPGAITASELGQEPAPSQITAIYKNP